MVGATNRRVKLNLLFDLDGTLTDPFDGITRSLQHAVAHFDVAVPPQEALMSYIGPPLRKTLPALIGSEDPAMVEHALRLYRERFSAVGWCENRVYDGIPALLDGLVDAGHRLFVCTAKPVGFARRIVEYFELARHFEAVYGSELDGRYEDKGELIGLILQQHGLLPAASLMIGDRDNDIMAARKARVGCIGVTWGYGDATELAPADALCHAPAELPAVIARLTA